MDALEARVKLLRDTRGAVYVEFLAVFLPLFMFFLSLIQLIFVQTASIITQHSAMTAVRAAAVVVHDDPAAYGGVAEGNVSGARLTDIQRAAEIPLAALGPEGQGVTVDIAGSYTRDQVITVTVNYDYKCRVPGGALVVCGTSGIKKLAAQASMPNQGAEYRYGK
jgi:Flp pilus assembly protein TadG